ncbi:hypothetical protein [Hyalangium rubrum]|uniref:MotA/TolQ/ExbB proton channel domain-containing protein n=1 Tax=Hyalangium rubrum TaxID=3103134 RepID=A0ABU5HF78_9BACT|nr:hypothetical protein [Hyalangium sp. s54d21]MDY7232113.1 hypothetical protein [Hyalangium sp. s54d21]
MTDSGSFAEFIGFIVGAIVSVAVQVLITWALRVWGRSVAERQGGSWWRRAAWMPVLSLGAGLLGMACTALSLVWAFQTVSADPAEKAALLAQSITRAMLVTAVFALVSGLLFVASIVVFTVGTLKQPRA